MTRMNGKEYFSDQFHRQRPSHTYALLPCLYRVLSKYLSPYFFSVVFELHFSPDVWTFSLTLILAGTALEGPKRKLKHARSLNKTDTAICQAPRASGRDVRHAHLANWSTAGP